MEGMDLILLIKSLVPVYDGREGLQLGKYWEKEYTGEVARGSTVMVLFSMKKGELAKAMQEVKNLPGGVGFGIYFQILGAVVLGGPSEQFSKASLQEGPEAFGVNNIQVWGEVEQEEAGGGSDGDNEEEEVDEPVL